MQIDRILYPVESLGPGNRLVIWTVGCSKHCPHCANKELWAWDDSRDIAVDELFQMIKKNVDLEKVDGVTFTGGDPMEQMDDLLELLQMIRQHISDILVYTGYTWQEIVEREPLKSESIRKNVSVLIDGRYVDELNDGKCVLRGSTNQKIYYFDPTMQRKYEEYMEKGRKVQNIYSDSGVVSVGIHNKES